MNFRVAHRVLAIALLFYTVLLSSSLGANAEEIKIGVLKSTSTGPIYIAVEKHYFDAEGLEPNLVTFASAQPISVAAAGSEIDVGVTAFTGGLFSLAGQGAIRIISGYAQNVPGFKFDAFVVSNKAWQEGVRTYKDFAGRIYGVSQIGPPPHYELALLAEKYGFDFGSVRISPLQSLANVASALTGGQIDATSLLGSAAIPLIARGDVKLLGWAGDQVPYQLGSIFTGAKTAADHPERLEKFLRVYRRAVHEYHDAFTAPDGKRADGPGADEIAGIMAKYTGLTVEQVKTGVVYFDREARVNEADVMRQVDWFLKQGLIKQPVDPKLFFDSRFVVREDQK